MKHIKPSPFFSILVFFGLLNFSASIHLSAQKALQKVKGYKGEISKLKLLSNFKKGNEIEGYVINGWDLRDIISKTNYDIKIKNSLIKNGLFIIGNKFDIKKDKLPKKWDEAKKSAFLEKIKSRTAWIIKNKISIVNSKIERIKLHTQASLDKYSLFSFSDIFYFSPVDFSKTIFEGGVFFSHSTFGDEIYYKGAEFSGEANFSGVLFNGRVDFRKTLFKKDADFNRCVFNEAKNSDDLLTSILDCSNFSNTIFQGGSFFSNAIFRGSSNFSNTHFFSANFSFATFQDLTKFNHVTFSDYAHFYKTLFNNTVDFSEAFFHGKAIFKNTTFAGYTYFKYAIFKDVSLFNRAIFRKPTHFTSAIFNKNTSFINSFFDRPVIFHNVTFRKNVDFFGIKCKDMAYFRKTFCLGIFSIKHPSFFKYVDFRGSRIKILDFTNELMTKIYDISFDFRKSEISEIYIEDAIFNKDMDFSDVTFGAIISELCMVDIINWAPLLKQLREKVHHSSSPSKRYILQNLNLSALNDKDQSPTSRKQVLKKRSQILEMLNHFIRTTDFPKNEWWKEIKFNKPVRKLLEKGSKGLLPNEIKLLNRLFIQKAFPGTIIPIEKRYNFNCSHVAAFRYVTFGSYVNFLRAHFLGDTLFERVNFKNNVNFTDADFPMDQMHPKKRFSLSYTVFNNLQIKWHQLPEFQYWISNPKDRIIRFRPLKKDNEKNKSRAKKNAEKIISEIEPLSEVLKRLEKIFHLHNDLDSANHAYFHRKCLELKEARQKYGFFSRLDKEIEWIFWGKLCGYGTKILWIIGWAAFFNLFFSILYSLNGNLKKEFNPKKKKEFSLKLRLLDLPHQYLPKSQTKESRNKGIKKIKIALRLSSTILFKIGFRDTTISGKIWGINYKYILWIEWVLGYYILAAIVITLSNTLPLFYKLVSAVF